MINKTPQRILAIGLPLVVVAATGVGYAYWTSAGSGTGSASTAAGAATLVLEQVAAPTDLAPGTPAGAVSVEVTNPTGAASSVKVSQVVATFTVAALEGMSCEVTDYELLNGTMTTGATELAPGTSTTFTGATLAFKNSTTLNQDGCKGATVNLSYAAS